MNKKLLKPRGTQDIFAEKATEYRTLYQKISNFLEKNNFIQIITPTYESKELFFSLGKETDIVKKEMFVFKDKKKEKEFVLRPEGTAPIIRSVNQNNLIKENEILKVFYFSNMFRYERPQKKRFREFFQFGIEIFNVKGFIADCETINVSKKIIEIIGIKNFYFKINYLGSQETKDIFNFELKKNLEEKIEELCEDCKERYNKNNLRILDCQNCKKLVTIKYEDYLNVEEREYKEKIIEQLNQLKIPFVFDEKLVRGLDYYTGIVFECILRNEKKSFLGGGRYDNLFEKITQKRINSIGMAIGIDRIIKNEEKKENLKEIDISFIWFEECCYSRIAKLMENITRKFPEKTYEINFTNEKNERIKIQKKTKEFSLLIGKKEMTNQIISIWDYKKKEMLVFKNNEIEKIIKMIKSNNKNKKNGE